MLSEITRERVDELVRLLRASEHSGFEAGASVKPVPVAVVRP